MSSSRKPEAELLAEGIAKDGGTLEQLRHAVEVALTSKPKSPAGFIRAAVRSAIRGVEYLFPTPKASHPSDLGERPQRVVSKPKKVIPSDWLPRVPDEGACGYCNEAVRLLKLQGEANPSDEEICDRARLLWQKISIKVRQP